MTVGVWVRINPNLLEGPQPSIVAAAGELSERLRLTEHKAAPTRATQHGSDATRAGRPLAHLVTVRVRVRVEVRVGVRIRVRVTVRVTVRVRVRVRVGVGMGLSYG